MKYLLILAALLVAPCAYAGYDTQNKNIVTDIDTMTVNETGANDYVYVQRVTNTTAGYGSVEKLRLQHLAGYVADLTATNTLTSADCGKTLMLNSATEFATTLPAPTAHCKLKFIVKAAPASASYTVVTASSGNVLIGHVVTADIDGAGDGDSSTEDDTITFADGVAAVGDSLELISDGTSWYYTGHAKTYNGITAAKAS